MKNIRVSKLVMILIGGGLLLLIAGVVALYLEKEREITDLVNAGSDADYPGFDEEEEEEDPEEDPKKDPIIEAVKEEFPGAIITDSKNEQGKE